MVRLNKEGKIDDEDKANILLCSLPRSCDHLATTLTYQKDTVNLDVTIATLSPHPQMRPSVEEGTQGHGLYVMGVNIVSGTRVKEVLERRGQNSRIRRKKLGVIVANILDNG